MSATWSTLSLPTEASRVEPGETAQSLTGPSWSRRVCTSRRRAASQTRTVPSSPADTIHAESGVIRRAATSPTWPVSWARAVPVDRSQIPIVPWLLPAAIQPPDGELAHESSQPRPPTMTRARLDGPRSGSGHFRTILARSGGCDA
jgi:hypothetical protein